MIEVKNTSKLVFELNALQIDYNKEKEDALIEFISKKYNVPKNRIEFNFVPLTVNDKGEKISLNNDIIENIQDPKFQSSLFKEYLELKGIEDIDMEAINAIDGEVNSYIDFDAYKNYKRYVFKYVKWSNYLSYGSDNFFDFTKLKGLVLLNGSPENQCGKTTFAIDLLRFALFGKADKSPTLDSVFNIYLPEVTDVVVEACIEIEGIDYIIKRTVTRPPLKKRTPKSKAKQTIEYFRLLDGETELLENCQDESVGKTNQLIKESVGTLEDFNLVMSATAYSLGELLRMGQSDKGRLFSRWLGLLSLEKKEEVTKKLFKEKILPTFESSKYNRETLQQEIDDYLICIDNHKNSIIRKHEEQEKSIESINRLDKEKSTILSSKKTVKDGLERLDVTTIETQITRLTNDLTLKRTNMAKMKEEYITNLKNAVFDKSSLDKARKNKEEWKTKTDEIRSTVVLLKKQNTEIQNLINQGMCPTCGQQIDVNNKNKHIAENNTEIEKLIADGIAAKQKVDEYDNEINQLELDKEKAEKKAKSELTMTALKSNIDTIKLQIAELERQKTEFETNKENLKWNNEINLKVNNINVSISNETRIKENIIKDIQNLNNDIKNYTKSIEDRRKLIDKIIKEEEIKRNWNIYQQLVGKNGIVKIVLKKALPAINNELSRLLNGLCDFKVILSISDDNKVCLDLYKDGQKLDLGVASSGFEGTMASLALRAALGNMATMPKPNFIVLDEIIGTIGSDNLPNVKKLFDRILSNYNFIIHITHMENIYDWHDMTITVVKNGNVSTISSTI